MSTVTIQQILCLGYAAFERTHRLPGYVRVAARALLACRTAALGGHVQRCPAGHVERVWYNSCRHRMCPQCAWLQSARWLRCQKRRLLACDHYHLIFTLPDELRSLWLANVGPLTTLLFATVRATLFELLEDSRYLGAHPGVIAALHTWSQTLVLHPHVHCLVTGGGRTAEGQWRAVRNGFLLPIRVVMPVFRGKLLYAIEHAVRQGTLALPVGMTRAQWAQLRQHLGGRKWNVHIRERYAHGAGVLTYVARYLRGGPITQARLMACTGDAVTFRARLPGEATARGDAARSVMTLPLAEFLRRYLLHVPRPGTHVVRGYGLYASTQRAALADCHRQLGHTRLATPAVGAGPPESGAPCPDTGERCPICGQGLVYVAPVPRTGRLPPGHVL